MKGWRTILLNGVVVVGVPLLTWIAGVDFTSLGLSPTVAAIILGTANILLRLITTTPVGTK